MKGKLKYYITSFIKIVIIVITIIIPMYACMAPRKLFGFPDHILVGYEIPHDYFPSPSTVKSRIEIFSDYLLLKCSREFKM